MDKSFKKEKYERVVSWLAGDKKPPISVEYNLTNNCNLNCISCKAIGNFDNVKDEDELSKKRSFELIKEAADFGVRKIQLSGGGEPLARKHSVELMKEIKGKGLIGDLITNGTLFSDEDINALVKNKWDSIKFSLEAPDAETNDYLRGKKGAFERTVKSIKKFQSLKESKGMEKPDITVNTVWNKRNYEKIPEMLDLCKKLGVSSFLLQPIRIKYSEYEEELKIKEEREKRKYLEKAKEKAEEYDIDTNLRHLKADMADKNSKELIQEEEENFLKEIICFSPFLDMKVSPYGEVGPCVGGESDMSLKESSLKEIWLSKRFNRFRKKVLMGKSNIPRFCENCCGVNIVDRKDMKKWIIENFSREKLEEIEIKSSEPSF